MNLKAERLAKLVKELRTPQSQHQFAKKLGVSRSSVTFWESGQAWPDTENLQKLALLKGWTIDELRIYLVEGDLPGSGEIYQLNHILSSLQVLPCEALAQIASAAVEALKKKTVSM
jgi:transcriptional regulator with XRE-family HTH domain